MTLDDLIDALETLRAQYPAAGTAIVGADWDASEITYDRGMVWLGSDEATDYDWSEA